MALILENVSYIYGAGSSEAYCAIDKVNLEISNHAFVALVGHTGSGKSTLVQLMNGLLKPSQGRVLVDDVDINEKGSDARKAKQSVGLVFQYPEYQLFEETIEKDIAFGPKNQGLSEEEQLLRVKEAMALVDLDYESWKERSPFELSGGQKRRVAIAGVLAMKPRYLILDEPTAGLDPVGRDYILDSIEKLYSSNPDMNIVLISHSMDDVARFANRIIVMNQGKKILDDEKDSIFSQKDLLESLHLSVPSVQEMMHALNKKGLSVRTQIYDEEQAFQEIVVAIERRSV